MLKDKEQLHSQIQSETFLGGELQLRRAPSDSSVPIIIPPNIMDADSFTRSMEAEECVGEKQIE